MASKNSAAAQRALQPNAPDVEESAPVFSKILSAVPRPNPARESAKDRHLAGNYRVIHGNVIVVRDPALWHDKDGNVKPEEPRTRMAIMGDICWFNDLDAASMLDNDIIEPVDTKPSRMGKVCVTNEKTTKGARA